MSTVGEQIPSGRFLTEYLLDSPIGKRLPTQKNRKEPLNRLRITIIVGKQTFSHNVSEPETRIDWRENAFFQPSPGL